MSLTQETATEQPALSPNDPTHVNVWDHALPLNLPVSHLGLGARQYPSLTRKVAQARIALAHHDPIHVNVWDHGRPAPCCWADPTSESLQWSMARRAPEMNCGPFSCVMLTVLPGQRVALYSSTISPTTRTRSMSPVEESSSEMPRMSFGANMSMSFLVHSTRVSSGKV